MGVCSLSSKKKRKYGQGGSAQYQQKGFLSGLGFGSFSSSDRRKAAYRQQGYGQQPMQGHRQAFPSGGMPMAAEPAGTVPSPAGMACTQCGTAIPAGSKFCLQCGAKVEQGGGFCASCGSQLPPGAKFCPSCGTPR